MTTEYPEQPDFELFRLTVQKDLAGENGDDQQEAQLMALFEGHLKHTVGCMNLWSGDGVSILGKQNVLISDG